MIEAIGHDGPATTTSRGRLTETRSSSWRPALLSSWLFRLSFILWIGRSAFGEGLAGAADLTSIIKDLRSFEQLYKYHDITVEYRHKQYRPTPLPKQMITNDGAATVQSVVQGSRFRSTKQGHALAADGKRHSLKYVRGYDGSVTRTNTGSAFTIADEPTPSMETLYPHAMVLCSVWGYPLSILYDKPEVIRSHPNAFIWHNADLEHRYAGMETVRGLACHRIETRLHDQRNGSRFVSKLVTVWLARDRNLLPVRSEAAYAGMEDAPYVVGEIDSFQQVDGVWCPKMIRVTTYWAGTKARPLPVDHIEEITFTSVSLNPSHPVEYFADVQPDPGMVVCQLRGGKVVDQWIHGQTSPAVFRFRRDWPGLLLLIACVVAAAVVWRQWRRAGAAA